jgi:hypothetical protein
LRGQANTEGDIIPTVYYKNNVISDVRMEYFSNNEEIIIIDEDGHYKMVGNGETTISVRILGNEISTIEIPVTVEDVTTIEYNIIVSPIITSIRQGLSNIITAKIVDNLNHEITDTITLTASGTDNNDNYSLVDNGDNTWTLTNKLKSKLPLTLTFSNTTYNVEYVMKIQLKAMY